MLGKGGGGWVGDGDLISIAFFHFCRQDNDVDINMVTGHWRVGWGGVGRG